MMVARPRRSVLYMPGSNARALEKARVLPADAVILDLEDAVAPDAKDVAREQVCAAVQAGGFGPREVIVRINALSSPWGDADIRAIAAAGPDVVLVPKIGTASDLVEIGERLNTGGLKPETWVFAMIETPQALLALSDIASASLNPVTRLAGFVLGTNDLAKDTRARLTPGRSAMLAWLSMTVAAARAYDLAVIDGVYAALKDVEGLRGECEQGRDLGMDGKTLIHPDQIGVANEVFAPSVGEIAQARTILAAFELPENQGKGAISVDGRMVERLHAEMAARTLTIAESIARM